MRKPILAFFALLTCIICATAQVITPATKPNATQRAMQERGYGMFIHFGPNTFNDTESRPSGA